MGLLEDSGIFFMKGVNSMEFKVNHLTKTEQYTQFMHFMLEHIEEYVVKMYGDFPDKTIAKFTPEKIQGKLEAYVDRIGKIENTERGIEAALKDCLKISHFSCYLYALLKHGHAQADLFSSPKKGK